jgi:hypothetical protein
LAVIFVIVVLMLAGANTKALVRIWPFFFGNLFSPH